MNDVRSVDGGRAYMIRHSQGDQWDLFLLMPMSGFGDRDDVDAELERSLDPLVAWREEVFVCGPPIESVDRAFDGAGLFHVEMFLAIPGKRKALLEERWMENDYLERVGRPTNLVFSRIAGAAWDLYTIGFYRDLTHFAEPADVSEEEEEKAAVKAGFEASNRIGTYLRTLIQSHHDTLAVPVH
jgi:hypothetical protein